MRTRAVIAMGIVLAMTATTAGASPGVLKARIVEMSQEPDGIRIVINKGTNHGVQVGWKGFASDKNGKHIEGSGFTITRVRDDECQTVWKLSPEQTEQAGVIYLHPPLD